MLEQTSDLARASAPSPAAPAISPGGSAGRVAFWLYASHLLGLFGLALSNVLLGIALLSAPWTTPSSAWSWRRLGPVLTACGLYLLILLAAIAASLEPRTSLPALGEAFSLSTLVLGVVVARGERLARRLADLIVLAATVFAAHGLLQYLVGYGDLDRRIRGPFSHYMTFSGVLLIADLLLIALLAAPSTPVAEPSRLWSVLRSRLWRVGALGIINLALLGSLTRSAWVAAAVALTLLVVARAPRLLLAYAPAAALFIVLAPVPWVARALSIVDLADVSNYDRICMAAAGATMIEERPLLGLGPEMVKHRYPLYRHPTAPRLSVPHLHDSFLQIAAERGLLGLISLLVLLGLAAGTAWRGLRAAERSGAGPTDLYLGSLAALVAFVVMALFEHSWGDTEVQRVLLATMALPFALRDGREGLSGAG